MMPIDLLIAGASARAAAFSAVRAGLRVAAADLFADRDLHAVTLATAISDWPAGLEAWAATFDRGLPLVCVGGLENSPDLLDRMAASRPIFGPLDETLRAVRTPELLAERFDRWKIPRPALWNGRHGDRSLRWLLKPRRSTAGRGIRWWTPADAPPCDDQYVQEFIPGSVGSAAFLAGDDGVELLGMTELLLPHDATRGVLAPFTYCGSMTADLCADIVDPASLDRLGRCIAETGLRGLFGIDFVWRETDTGGEPVPLEVNPRYTAGMEVLEWRQKRSLIAEHVAVFLGTRSTRPTPTPHDGPAIYGKQIVYAQTACRVGELPIPSRCDILSFSPSFEIADVSRPGTTLAAGAPICTVFATGRDRSDCLNRLREREDDVLARCRRV